MLQMRTERQRGQNRWGRARTDRHCYCGVDRKFSGDAESAETARYISAFAERNAFLFPPKSGLDAFVTVQPALFLRDQPCFADGERLFEDLQKVNQSGGWRIDERHNVVRTGLTELIISGLVKSCVWLQKSSECQDDT